MKRLTPQEFLEKWKDENAISFCYEITCGQIAEIAKLYAEHIEETAWQEIDEMPPVDPMDESGTHSINVLIETQFQVVEGFVDLESEFWFSAQGHRVAPLRWRQLPTPPKNP